jgi:hypothetical protein
MLKEIHFLLTYTCLYECDHCFVYSGPEAEGTFSRARLVEVFGDIPKIGSVEKVYFEGGESFLFYPLLLEGVRLARDMGLKVGLVTNSYWATSVEDAELWLEPLVEAGIEDISLSDDAFHFDSEGENPAQLALQAAENLGMAADRICIEEPFSTIEGGNGGREKGTPVVGGDVLFRGRAVEKLTEEWPTRPWEKLNQCPHEELEQPYRVHLDPFGNVHVCQGVSMGNAWGTPLSRLLQGYKAAAHPICGPLIKGGPAQLVRDYQLQHDDAYIDECHLCYLMRSALIDRFPQVLAPRQVYGLEQG